MEVRVCFPPMTKVIGIQQTIFMKDTTSVRIDANLKHQAKVLGINMSKTLNDVLKGMISNYSNQEVNMIEIENEINITRDKIAELKAYELELLSKKTIYEEKVRQTDQKEIKELVDLGDAVKRTKRQTR